MSTKALNNPNICLDNDALTTLVQCHASVGWHPDDVLLYVVPRVEA